ncbi:hypothetical protein PF005_g17992 [Phytophthora fragariae]|uniref:PiggyBac transposable element-derived protein domain-containing protein n=1 Tax=Phytophthora fragariae TaxID=53985 RepID=A0A6A3F5B1_9STRA|nr:hypothetical protein PF003_g25108 [Phytophthora fragariae]KAE8940483.1 hypothetical protein PF009_g9705 [Phytophthora fragariae]KAE8990327.1 hypothetical protein PF011_g18407 [Phytophthora fragariae]KAE9089434.1 hypothetical protein PF010_g18997 [Phytophthora fragariae]KAE9089439.1 hypothetical protein PF007_g19598 [Phytophthora fragariae]
MSSQLFGEEDQADPEEPIVGGYDTSDWDDVFAPESRTGTERNDVLASSYISALKNSSGLRLVNEEGIKKAYQAHGELGLFSVFITPEFKRSLRKWTNIALETRGVAAATAMEFDAYIGLEFTMSICPLNDISDFWS